MKVSYRWLRKYVECQIPVAELAHRLTMAGLEVDGIEPLRYAIPERVVVGEIVDVQPHPDASALFVCHVLVGEPAPRTIVCGASNAKAHVKVAVALPGATLPNGITIREAVIRGVPSAGMICAEDELGISDDHRGIMHLPADLQVGQPVSAALLGLDDDDAIIEIGLTPNRGDCLSHVGVAREIATLLNLPLIPPAIAYPENGEAIEKIASVEIRNPELCHRYTASAITGVKIAPSPLWLKRALESVGVRSINNVVDVTNYVMLELGQPLHAFDLAKLHHQKIIVKTAQPGSTFTSLDGTERQLDETILMIADAARDVGIAGVMGGLNSEVSDTTTDILLESARFSPSNIRKTSKKLGLATEASYRFERTVDLYGCDVAVKRATQLILQLAGGAVAQGIIDAFPRPEALRRVSLRFARMAAILGVSIAPKIACRILSSLGFQIAEQSSEGITVEIPSFRPDVEREIDVIEEVGRIHGFEAIPTTLPSGEIPLKTQSPELKIEQQIRDSLIAQGWHEAINYSFFDKNDLHKLGIDNIQPYDKLVHIKNPLTAEQDVLRTTAISSLLENARRNLSNRIANIRLFEVGTIFTQHDVSQPLPEEQSVVSGVLIGQRMDVGWAQSQDFVDFYDIKGLLELMFTRLNLRSYEFRRTDEMPFLHPGEAAAILIHHEPVGIVGRIHPNVLEAFDIAQERVYVFEVLVAALTKYAFERKQFSPLPKFPAVHRDLALIVPTSVQASDLEAVIVEVGQPLLEHVVLFDRYVGQQIAEGHVSLTYSLRYRSTEKTLTDDEVTTVHQRMIETLQTRLQARLR
ncbi:phenylalanyl-tRNA synthetase, beta subunit [Candidatus Moduliflexus flocculans]|uniref:Phenylalanine--tRNA ligase beta subunit n=1 Tax=Candidatus Moduliflexus flocculans TaxID=1499966 RepID=A0A081BSX0_9BACT|nr:phenylalanyl-tRNA synthetase, beta subunit [Candidatus Moduliflexus flocculans]